MAVDFDVYRGQQNEKRALKIVGVCFLALAAYIAYESVSDPSAHRNTASLASFWPAFL
jgi:hypothetical protein